MMSECERWDKLPLAIRVKWQAEYCRTLRVLLVAPRWMRERELGVLDELVQGRELELLERDESLEQRRTEWLNSFRTTRSQS